ncbi:hypothetical protein BJX99DRAFT_256105 [Aspergillus californicus]
MRSILPVFALALLAAPGVTTSQGTPEATCWPSPDYWNALNTSVAGQLIHNIPTAAPCYHGVHYDESKCALIYAQWSNPTFQGLAPVGYSFPIDNPCPPLDLSLSLSLSQNQSSCTLGMAPVYTINATEPEHIAVGIAFARRFNVRLVVRNTGHDMLARSTGYGALQIWIKYMRKGIIYHDSYKCSSTCAQAKWTGPAFTIAGGYVWGDVYPEVAKRNLTVVGGADPTVGCIGGYIQGGGHSPASRDYGLAADQVLEAQIILANGTALTVNPCQTPDLYAAIRGGGGGTYGIVTSITIKAYPSKPVIAQRLLIESMGTETELFLDTITEFYTNYPALSDAGFSGYGLWSINSPIPLFGDNKTAGYSHTLAAMGQTLSEAHDAFAPLLEYLQQYNGTLLSFSITWFQFPTYAAYFQALSGTSQPVGSGGSASSSRMFDKDSLTESRRDLRQMIEIIAGRPEEHTVNSIELVGGGEVLAGGEKEDLLTRVNPAWRLTYLVHFLSRGWPEDADAAAVRDIEFDVTYTKTQAMRDLTPSLSSYMNEADRNNPAWKSDFYGAQYDALAEIKEKFDPEGILYCPTCVGSDMWYQKYLPGGVWSVVSGRSLNLPVVLT